jgi:hypothetical protein
MKMSKSGLVLSAFVITALAAAGVGCELVASVDRNQIQEGAGGTSGAGGNPQKDGSTDADVSQDVTQDVPKPDVQPETLPDTPIDTPKDITPETGPSCTNSVQDGDETDVDCGGAKCTARCIDGKKCKLGGDCQSGVCGGTDGGTGTCTAPSCTDKVKNGTETDIDCGGTCATKCDNQKACKVAADCKSGVCDSQTLLCVAPGCTDKVQNGKETDVDCGGGDCSPCDDAKKCGAGTDCKSKVCGGADGGAVPDGGTGTCTTATCSDGVANGTETDTDCGGSCTTKCADGKKCGVAADCQSVVCNNSTKVCDAATCSDSVKNGTETDVDCGGTCTTKCADGKGCTAGTDCQSKVCNAVDGGLLPDGGAATCVAATCTDTVQNGTETDVDCGGSCTKCGDGKKCGVAGDCTSGVCAGTPLVCVNAQCNDQVKNGTETDVDCGGSTCPKCAFNKVCAQSSDCIGGTCTANVCVATCTDTVKNGAETDVDCGGATCPKCAFNKVCTQSSDCVGGTCTSNVCVATCTDTVKNGTETDVDCGGSCTKCGDGKTCAVAGDCTSGVCSGTPLTCKAPTCSDTVKNGSETDVDCGGTTCNKCGFNKACAQNSDCIGGTCTGNVCVATCTDTVKNGTETDVDCGGATCPKCADTKTCAVAGDCTSGVCSGTPLTCKAPTCSDTVKNGTETDIDCGGATCNKCVVGKSCLVVGDCLSNVCGGAPLTCGLGATCTNTTKDGTETDVDCGGGACSPCANGRACAINSDCASNKCTSSVCVP